MWRTYVLLLFCCVAGTLTFARSQEDSTTLEQSSIIVSIPADGEFYLGKHRIALAEISEKLKQLLKDRPPDEQIVYIKAASDVRYGTVVTVVNAIRELGVDRIGLVADKKNKANVAPSLPEAGPTNSSSETNEPIYQGTIVIEVKGGTQINLNSREVPLSGLGSRLKAMLDGRSDKAIFIKAPATLNYGEVVKVIDLAKAAGAYPIGLQTD